MLDTLLATAPIAAMGAAVFSAYCAFLSYRLSRRIQNDLESDERLVVGPLQKPDLANASHGHCVVVCTLFNKSRRKVCVGCVRALDENGQEIAIKWGSRIDPVGNPLEPFGLLGIVDSINLYVRRNDGEEIDYMTLTIKHSFANSPETVVYNAGAGWFS